MKKDSSILNLILISITCLFFTISCKAQQYLNPNEELIFSFKTLKGKKVVIAMDKNEGYLVYRYGNSSHVEFEFPKNNDGSWKQFTYSYWLRGGGIENEGIDLNYLQFTHEGIKYVIYHTYYAADNSKQIGIRIFNLKNNKKYHLKGIIATQKGSLIDLRNNELITQSMEMFD